jgi:hypothetical protein
MKKATPLAEQVQGNVETLLNSFRGTTIMFVWIKQHAGGIRDVLYPHITIKNITDVCGLKKLHADRQRAP